MLRLLFWIALIAAAVWFWRKFKRPANTHSHTPGEQSAAPMELNAMMTNIENNGAPWQYSQMDRLNWKEEA